MTTAPLTLEEVFCFKCNTNTEHIVRRRKDGTIKSKKCCACKHKHDVAAKEV